LGAHITPSPERSRGNGLETRPGAKPLEEGGVALNLPHPSRSPRPSRAGEGGQMGTPTLCPFDYTCTAVFTTLIYSETPLALDFDAHVEDLPQSLEQLKQHLSSTDHI
jgi:hypothetical protein